MNPHIRPTPRESRERKAARLATLKRATEERLNFVPKESGGEPRLAEATEVAIRTAQERDQAQHGLNVVLMNLKEAICLAGEALDLARNFYAGSIEFVKLENRFEQLRNL